METDPSGLGATGGGERGQHQPPTSCCPMRKTQSSTPGCPREIPYDDQPGQKPIVPVFRPGPLPRPAEIHRFGILGLLSSLEMPRKRPRGTDRCMECED